MTWLEDQMTPRSDELTRPLRPWGRKLFVAHPEWFRAGDIVRPLPGREAVWVKGVSEHGLKIKRRIGRSFGMWPATSVVIVGANMSERRADEQARFWRFRRIIRRG